MSSFAVRAARKAAAEAAERAAAKAAKKAASSLTVAPRPKPKPVVKALPPPPPPPLALPAPGPGLPEFAAKPRGGQWWADRDFDGSNVSPEEAARQGALSLALTRWVPEGEGVVNAGQQITETPAQKWLERALTKYYKNEFGTPEDPLRDLAARGLHYDPDMTPEKWKATVDSYLMEDPIGSIMFPYNRQGGMPGAGSNLRGETLAAMPWLAKQPVTDKVYGISSGGLDLSHFTDEFLNALNDAEAVGLPADFAVRPESLARMTFPQAVERVGRINQFRAKEMERAALDAQNNPVTHVFKEYADDNPMGLRWVEMAPPKGDGPTNYDVEEELAKALKYEGDTMGHCVGGYCPDVMSGRSRIFSLRDAKGEPHVTVETKPRPMVMSDLVKHLGDDEALAEDYLARGFQARDAGQDTRSPLSYALEMAGVPQGQDIIQIKGKQNRAPKDDYLPFVQDFVKSGQWGNVGDLGNTGLVRLPDGRYITQSQYDEARARAMSELLPGQVAMSQRPEGTVYADNWDNVAPYFEGYAIGGRVDRNRCFSRHPMSAR